MKKRNLILACGMVIQFCAGIIYGWSVFRGPVAAHLEWEAGAASLTSSIMLAMFVLGIILGGRAQDKLGPKKMTLAGSILIGAGMLCLEGTGALSHVSFYHRPTLYHEPMVMAATPAAASQTR